MKPFTTITSSLLPLPYDDVDTDQIIPAAYLKVTDKDGLVQGLFARWRFRPDGSLEPAFALNRSEYRQAAILLAGDNFGCGSSREHAPWALLGWGFRAVISTSFADIFCSNGLKNGLLPVVVNSETHRQLFELVEAKPLATVTIDLAQQTVTLPDGRIATFPIDPFSKSCLLAGVDQLGYLLRHETQIAAYEAAGNPQP
jgi:3-isopropylmalate/(R)-2-methylmalate dehydratase small subunit